MVDKKTVEKPDEPNQAHPLGHKAASKNKHLPDPLSKRSGGLIDQIVAEVLGDSVPGVSIPKRRPLIEKRKLSERPGSAGLKFGTRDANKEIIEGNNANNAVRMYNGRLDKIVSINSALSNWDERSLEKLLTSINDGSLRRQFASTDNVRNFAPDGQFYKTHKQKHEEAPAFFERVYGAAGANWLNGEFTRADLRKIDPVGEKCLRDWEFRNGRKADINLPTLKEKNDRLVDTLPAERTPEEREAHRKRESVRRRLAKAQKTLDPS